MEINLDIFKSKVARRIFILFVVSALFPIVSFALLSFSQVLSQLEKQGYRQLHNESKSYGLAVYEKLSFMEKEIKLFIHELENASTENYDYYIDFLGNNFKSIYYQDEDGTHQQLLGYNYDYPKLDQKEYEYVINGGTLLKIDYEDTKKYQILFIRRINWKNNRSGLLIGVINEKKLWEIERKEIDLFFIFDRNGDLLFYTDGVSDKTRDALIKNYKKANASFFNWKSEENNYYSYKWNLFLAAKFYHKGWDIVISEPEEYTLTALNHYKRLFPKIAFMALLIVILLSVFQIKKILIPLQMLLEGINRIIKNDFHTPVLVNTDDEFKTLAKGFNNMSDKIQDQLQVLSALAEIDRMILSSFDREYILETLVKNLHALVHANVIGVISLNENTETALLNYSEKIHFNEVKKQEITISSDDLNNIEKSGYFYKVKENISKPEFLDHLIELKIAFYKIYPVKNTNNLVGYIVLGFYEEPALSDIEIDLLNRLSDRVAVALSNAAWEEKLYNQAHYDFLTGLPNRFLLRDRLHQAIKNAERKKINVALLYLDLDRFKIVNDSLGHSAGDELLIVVSNILTKSVRKYDTVVRLGGDEFTIIIPDVDNAADTFETVNAIANRIRATLKEPVNIRNRSMFIMPSMGVAIYPKDADSYDDLLKNADSAMYAAKKSADSDLIFYSREFNKNASRRLKLEYELRKAIENQKLEIYYQPQYSCITEKLIGVEALLRWHHNELGTISPGEFIPIAEETGLIVPIGKWVINEVCMQNKQWQQRGMIEIKAAVNIAAEQFNKAEFVDFIKSSINKSGLSPEYLELELTERTTIEHAERAIKILTDLKEIGVKLSIDDFGTGYSSMNYLQRFPIDTLKIDQSFIKGVPNDYGNVSIVKSILALAHELNLTVIAEGVETEEQHTFLINNKCEEIQGYLFSKPLPLEEFEELLIQESNKPKIKIA